MSKSSGMHFTASMQTEASWPVNAPVFFPKPRLHNANVAGKFRFRQGLWIEALRIPPGQECSNGSLILFAVVLWRAFFANWREPRACVYSARKRDACATMKLLKTKAVRFSQVVEKCGEPDVYTLWQKPTADRHFQTQIKNNRVMTVQKSESGTDFGIVGFKERKGATYFVFPKSLKRFLDKRTIGIDWALVRD